MLPEHARRAEPPPFGNGRHPLRDDRKGLDDSAPSFLDRTEGRLQGDRRNPFAAVLPIDEEAGRQAGNFLRRYRQSHGIEIADALIGAAANRAELWTRNRKHYPMKEVSFFD